MNSNSIRGRALPAVALLLALIAVVALVASGALGRAGDPGPTPSAPPSNTPTSTPTPSPTPEPTETPADGFFNLDLDTADDHDVSIIVDDRTGTVVEVSSGRAGDGMSVRWLDAGGLRHLQLTPGPSLNLARPGKTPGRGVFALATLGAAIPGRSSGTNGGFQAAADPP